MIRYRLGLCFALFLTLPVTAKSLEYQYDFSRLFTHQNWSGAWHRVPGEPSIPVLVAKIVLPYTTTLKSVKADPVEGPLDSFPIRLERQGFPKPLCSDSDWTYPLPDREAPELDTYPGTLMGKTTLQQKNGFSILFVPLYPLQYSSETEHGTFTAKAAVHIELSPAPVQPLFRGLRADRDEILGLVDNPKEALTYPVASSDPSATYLFVGPDWLLAQASVQTLGQAKRQIDILPIYLPLSTVHAYLGRDLQEQIRAAIADMYSKTNLRFVLLVGNGTWVPSRLFHVPGAADEQISGDFYYGCLDGDFDSNHNNRFGESTDGPDGEEPDLLCEVAVGRAPVATAEELRAFVDKTLQADSLSGGDPRVLQSLFIGEKVDAVTLTSWSLDKILQGDLNAIATQGFDPNIKVTKLYETFDESITASDVLKQMNEGNFYTVDHAGHGTVHFDMKFENYLIPMLHNTLPYFSYSQGCDVGDLSQSNWASQLVVSDAGGAFAMVANSSLGFFISGKKDGPSNLFNRAFYDEIFKGNVREVGKVLQLSKESLVSEVLADPTMRWIYYENNLLGDPALPFKFPKT